MALALTRLLSHLEEIAPLHYAEDWDNVGLLIDPRAPGRELHISNVLLTIDATPSVVEELAQLEDACLVAYHPPLFRPVQRLSHRAQPWLFQAIAQSAPVFSPHTALDGCPGGINDWLAEGAGKGSCSPLHPLPSETAPPGAGKGRRVVLDEPQPLHTMVERFKQHLGLAHLRLAAHPRHDKDLIHSVGVAAGAGSSVFDGAPPCDLLVTGECSHHSALAHRLAGSSLIAAEHTNTERGYLPRLAERLQSACEKHARVHVAQSDRDPMQVV